MRFGSDPIRVQIPDPPQADDQGFSGEVATGKPLCPSGQTVGHPAVPVGADEDSGWLVVTGDQWRQRIHPRVAG